jgi:ankyrin repeat protein
MLVKSGANLNGRLAYGDVALIKAAEHGNDDIIEYLIEKGADVNVPNQFGLKPFSGHCGGGSLKLVQLAAKHGGDVNSSFAANDDEGAGRKNLAPLQAAAAYDRLDVVELLISLGANPGAKDYEGQTSIEIAESKGHADVADFLRKQSKSVRND